MKNTLLVDGNNILQIGFHGVKNVYNKDKHLGAIYHFVTTLQRHLLEDSYDKVVIFWDGPKSSHFRKEIQETYKANRKKNRMDVDQFQSMMEQKNRISEYLEELFIRQCQFDMCEADDGIAYYCHNSPDEFKTVLSEDKDLTQLIGPQVSQYLPRKKIILEDGDKVTFGKTDIPSVNTVLVKVLIGDKSDNIEGIWYLGEKTLLSLFPEIVEREVGLDEVLKKTKRLVEEDGNTTRGLLNLYNGKCKSGIKGKEFFEINKLLVDLEIPYLTDEAKSDILDTITLPMDPTDRKIENVVTMTLKDGLSKFLPKNNNQWLDFFEPFVELIKKEMYNFKNYKKDV